MPNVKKLLVRKLEIKRMDYTYSSLIYQFAIACVLIKDYAAILFCNF